MTSTKKANREEDLDWRFELKRRLDQHTARKKGEPAADYFDSELTSEPEFFGSEFEASLVDPPESDGRKGHSVLEYKLGNEKKRNSLKNPVKPEADYRAKASDELFEKPLLRVAPKGPEDPSALVDEPEEKVESDKTETEKVERKKRRPSDLDPMLPMIFDAKQAPRSQKADGAGEVEKGTRLLDHEDLSREILFSRFLAGIIDVTLPILMALALTALASWILNFDVFMTETMVWVGALAISLHLFTSLFFFTTSGQTLGMYFTELQLAAEDETNTMAVPVSGITMRVVLFIPVAVSVVGLLWALFDDRCRCLHDVISGTQIVKQEEETNYLRRRPSLSP